MNVGVRELSFLREVFPESEEWRRDIQREAKVGNGFLEVSE